MKITQLPYFNERKTDIDMLVIHCQAFDVKEAIDILHQYKLSSHYMIGLDGKIYRLVEDNKRAWHTKTDVSHWKGLDDINSRSVGIEICSLSLGQEQYTKKQIASVLRLSKTLIKKYHIKKQNIVGHSDICPNRKPDPGKAFPWAYFARHGVGLWYDIKDAKKVEETNESKMLSEIGYNIEDLTAAKWAFCKRFMPEIIPSYDIKCLIDKPVPEDADKLMESIDFNEILKAVYYRYCKK